jgi:hypothetical protein
MTSPHIGAVSPEDVCVGRSFDRLLWLDKAEGYGLKVARAAARRVQDLNNAMHAHRPMLLQGIQPSSPTGHARIVFSRPYGTV